ncbi:MAG TPA: hypothetical protein VKC61_20905 [Pyrinomonadaceae bacterium]|nr:hypothetical protein [Pyrinomonadaceae bacterium]
MKNRRVKACIASLTAVRVRGGLGPDQEQAIEFAILRLKKLNRLKTVTKIEVFNCVAEISERLAEVFAKSKIDF